MPVELAVGYVSLVTDTSKIPAQIDAALGRAGQNADRHGSRIGQAVGKGAQPGVTAGIKSGLGLAESGADDRGQRIGERMGKGVKSGFTGTIGGLGAALGLSLGAATFGKVLSLGNDFTTSMNTMRAVAGATGNEMAQVSERAKQLGNDITLPGTSATDAASAMVELAKGGFSVRQSMDAAKGSLQLAAAAQVGAAEAATIQVGALQAFGLAAGDAGHVADVLANSANASSAEITDVAYALQASGAVAHQFGLSIEDTAAAIGLFANSGIKGSDAGTLLKSALLALTDQGKPAVQAMQSLGLTVYDAQGKFVGLHSLFGQLQDASKRMTDQQYQAATATLFGSDAARLAGIAAEKGAAGFDQMHDAMSRQNSAADVANAKMQGLPGAMQQMQNSAEALGLELYDLVKGPLENLAKKSADFINDATPGIVNGLHAAADGAVGFGQAVAPVVKWISDLPAPVLVATAALGAFRATGIGDRLSSATATSTNALRGFGDQMKLQQGLAAASGQSIGNFGAAVATLEARVPVLGRMSESFRNTAESATVFARTQGTIAAASTGIRSAASGVVGMLGGPYALALAGGVAALTANIDSAHSAQQAQRALADATAVGARAQADFGKAVAAANGGLSDQAVAAGSAAVKASLSEITTLGDRGHKPLEDLGHQIDNITGNIFGSNDAWEKNYDKVTANVERYNALRDVMGDLKLDMDGVGQVVTQGGPAYDSLISKLQASGDAGKAVAQNLIDVHNQLTTAARAAQSASPGFLDLSAAVKVLADQSSSAADRVDAMKTALDVMSGKPIAVQDALAKYNQQLRETATATGQAWDKSLGFGQALIGQGGQVDTATENGKRLYDFLVNIRNATITMAEAGADMGPVLAGNDKQFQELAASTGLSVEQIRAMGEQLGLLPKDITILAQLKGADTAQQQLVVIDGLLRTNAQGIDIPVTALTDEAKQKLEETGAKIDTVVGKDGIVHISAPNLPDVLSKLDELINKKLPDKTQNVTVAYAVTGDPAARQQVQDQTGGTGNLFGIPGGVATPRANGGIDNLPASATIWSPRTRFYQVSEPETGGEAFIPLAASKRARSVDILGQVAGMFGLGLTKMADGGVVPRGVAAALAGARNVTGIKYLWGGTTTAGFDCSGFVGWLQQLLQGVVGPTQRLYTTMSLLGGATAGLKPGFGPSGTYFQVGVNQEHMAATLNGQPVESGGTHGDSRIGAPAVGATDKQFTAHFYLPNELIAGIGETGVSAGSRSKRSKKKTKEWTEQDQIDLEQLQVDLEDAKKDRADMDKADSKKTDLDKRKADLRIRETEQKLVEKQQEKDKASANDDGYVPQAPALEKRMSNDEIDREQAQLAIDEAEANRDEVYADPESTDNDKRKADLALQSARNAQDDLLAKQAKTTPAGSVAESLKQFGASIFGAAVDAVRAQLPFGIGQSRFWDIKPPDMDKASKPPTGTFSQDEVNKQLPVTPGVADLSPYLTQVPPGIRDWMKTLPAITLHDQGGWLKPGELALNMSKRPEPIFNSPAQMARFMGGAGDLAPAASASSDYSVVINNPSFSDGQAAIKAATAYQERQIMRRAGRP